MARCLRKPEDGEKLFDSLEKEFGYEVAKKGYLLAINNKFKDDYKTSLVIDEDGIPTYDSLMSIPFFKNQLSVEELVSNRQKEYKPLDNTLENYNSVIRECTEFNSKEENKHVLAIADVTDDNVQVKIVDRTPQVQKIYQSQMAENRLVQDMANQLSEAGITIGLLKSYEQKKGVNGLTDFSNLSKLAESSVEAIRLAKGQKGRKALSEEFCHLAVASNKDKAFISRAIKYLSANEDAIKSILGDEYRQYSEEYGNNDVMAEEALGKILNDMLSDEQVQKQNQGILERCFNWFKNLLKRFNETDVERAIREAKEAAGILAEKKQSGENIINRELLSKQQKDQLLYNIEDLRNKGIEILKNAAKTESRRSYIIKDFKRETSKKREKKILSYTEVDADFVEGLFRYGDQCAKDMKTVMDLLDKSKTTDEDGNDNDIHERANNIMKAKHYIESYDFDFIKNMNELASMESDEDYDQVFGKEFEIKKDGEKINQTLGNMYTDVRKLIKEAGRQLADSMESLAEDTISPWLGDGAGIDIKDTKGNYKHVSVKELLKTPAVDISMTDMWLDSMADTSNPIGQALNMVVSKQQMNAREDSIVYTRKVYALMDEAKKMGISDFSWMFEKYDNGDKTGYVIDAINKSQFYKDKREFEKQLDEKYGKVATGEKAEQKTKEYNKWVVDHCEKDKSRDVYLPNRPNKSKYRNKNYDRLTTNQKDFIKSYMALKNEIDSLYGRNTTLMVQKRRSGLQRITDIRDPKSAIDAAKNALKEEFYLMEDDVDIFGDNSCYGLTDFSNNEILKVPKVLRVPLKDPNELSEDIFGGLIEYGYAGNQYYYLNQVVSQVELTEQHLRKNYKIVKTKHNKPIFEKHKVGDDIEEVPVEAKDTNFFKKLNEWKMSQLYMKYNEDEGTLFGTNVSKQKTTDFAIKTAALAQLGCNWLANAQNAITGICMNNIEAACGQYFNAKELAKADGNYMKMLGGSLKQLYSKKKDNDLDLIMEYFNYKEDYNKTIRENRQSGWRGMFERISGKGINFIGQEAGDHWLYNRIALAYMLHTKVYTLDPNTGKHIESNVLDIVKKSFVTDKNTGLRRLELPMMFYSKNDKPFDPSMFGKRIAHINHGLYGIYNDEDRNAANRTCIGKMLIYLRKWIKPQLNKRFMDKQYSAVMDEYEEGYYHTIYRLAKEQSIARMATAILLNNKEGISEEDWYNIKRARAEYIQTVAFAILAMSLNSLKNKYDDDDDEMPYLLQLATYISNRTLHEIGALTPSHLMVTEGFKTVSSPSAVIDPMFDLTKLAIHTLTLPTNMFGQLDEVQSGNYKGDTKIYKEWMTSPLPIFSQRRNWTKFWEDLDTGIRYYAQQ